MLLGFMTRTSLQMVLRRRPAAEGTAAEDERTGTGRYFLVRRSTTPKVS